MTKKTARIKIVADGKVQYVDVDVTVDDPPAKSTPSTPTGTTSATPTPARKSPLGCLLVPVIIIGIVFLCIVFFPKNSSPTRQTNDNSSSVAITEDYNAQMAAAAAATEEVESKLASSVFLKDVYKCDPPTSLLTIPGIKSCSGDVTFGIHFVLENQSPVEIYAEALFPGRDSEYQISPLGCDRWDYPLKPGVSEEVSCYDYNANVFDIRRKYEDPAWFVTKFCIVYSSSWQWLLKHKICAEVP